MRRRQPDVQRDDAGLHSESGEKQQKRRAFLKLLEALADGVEICEIVAARRPKQEQEAENETPGSRMRHDEKQNSCPARAFVLMVVADERVCRQRHHLPRNQKEEGVGGGEHHGQTEEEQVIETAE